MFQPGDPAYDVWLQSMGAMQPLALEAPELAPPIVGSLPPGQLPAPPPPPPPPPPQNIGPAPFAPVGELPTPEGAAPAPMQLPTPELPPPADTLPDPPMPELAPVGSVPPVNAFNQPLTPEENEPGYIEMPADDLSGDIEMDAEFVGDEGAPVGHQRTTAGEGELSLSTEEILALTPQQQAAYAFDQQEKRDAIARERMAEIQRTDAARQAELERDYLDSQEQSRKITAAAIADAEVLANEKPKKFTDSIGNVVSALAGIFISTMVSPQTGEKALGVVQQRMDRFAQEQIDEYNRKAGNVDRRLNIAARLRDAGYSDYQAATVIRMAGLQRMHDHLLTDLQNYDPRGTTAMKRAQMVQQTKAAIAKNAMDFERQNTEDRLKETQLAKAQLEVEEKARKLAGIGAGGGKKAPAYFKALYPNNPVPPTEMTEKEYDKWIRTTSAGAEASQKIGAETPEQQRVRELGVSTPAGLLINKDGQPFLARDKTIAEKITKQVSAAGETVDIIDEILAIRDQHGGESKVFNSDARQRLDVLENRLVILQKSGTEGMSSDEDMKKLSAALGASDVASFRARTAGLKEGRERTMSMLNRTLSDNGYTGKVVKFHSTADLPAAKVSVVDEVAGRIARADYGAETTASMVRNATAPAMGTTKRDEEDFTILESYALQANNSNPRIAEEGQQAVEALKRLAERAPSPTAKRKAKEILKRLPGSKPPRPH